MKSEHDIKDECQQAARNINNNINNVMNLEDPHRILFLWFLIKVNGDVDLPGSSHSSSSLFFKYSNFLVLISQN